MKIIVLILMFSTSSQLLFSQKVDIQSILENYLSIKDALVEGDAKQAALSSGELLITVNKVDLADLKAIEKKSFVKEKPTLIKYANKINETENIEKQRAAFAELSISIWELVKNAESITQTVYYQYCPMKKSYWISMEEEIKNPYYGSKMLTCGNIFDQKIK